MEKLQKIHRIRSIRDTAISVCDSMMYEDMKEYDEICVLGGLSSRINILIKQLEKDKK